MAAAPQASFYRAVRLLSNGWLRRVGRQGWVGWARLPGEGKII